MTEPLVTIDRKHSQRTESTKQPSTTDMQTNNPLYCRGKRFLERRKKDMIIPYQMQTYNPYHFITPAEN